MPTRPIFKLLQISLLFLLVQFGVASLARAQNPITLKGRVLFSSGQPASGATVTMKKEFYDVFPSVISTETSVTDGGGNYSFPSQGRCAVSYKFQAVSAEIVDDEPLPPSGSGGPSGCVLSNYTVSDLEISRPVPITLGGYVTDEQSGQPVEGITVTMTRTKYDFQPNVVTTATTTTDGSGHYQFSTFSRCSVVEDFRPSLGSYTFHSGVSPSGCVLINYYNLDLTVNFNNLMNAGAASCNAGVGGPVNVTNGNMYLQQTDYQLPGAGEAIAVSRTYNSISQNTGLFGRGWSTMYDEVMTTQAGDLLQLTLPDGRVVTTLSPDFHGQMVRDGDGSYTVTFKDGGVHRFNAAGKLLSLTDRHGNQTLLTYTNDTLSSITDPFARVLTVTTNANGRVLSLSDALGTIATYTYGGSNQLLTTTYADNSGYTYSYTGIPGGLGLSMVTNALGNIVEQHDYDLQGRATSSQAQGGVNRYTLSYIGLTETDVTDALGHVTKYFYGNIKGRSVVTRVEGLCSCGGSSQVQTWTYDNQANVTAKTDALNHTNTFTYDAEGNRLTETDATGTVTYTYNQFREVLLRTDQMNGLTGNSYDAQGNLVSSTNALGKTTNFTYDPRGLLLTATDARGKMTSLAYDASGNLITRTDALSHETQFGYDARGQLARVTNALGHQTFFYYDPVGRPAQVTQPDGTLIVYEYDRGGRRIVMFNARGVPTSYGYDGANRLTSETDFLGQTTSYSYDLMSNLTARTDALGRVTNYDYDDFNRLVKITYPPATTGATRLFETRAYDASGNVTQRTDTAGRVNQHAYDNVNRVVSTTDTDNKTTSFEYDSLSRMTALVDALDQRYRFNFDALGQIKHIRRGTAVMSFTYDVVGNRKQRTDYNGVLTTYDYDALNRLKTINYPDTTSVSYTYDKLSRLQTGANENGSIDFDYNKMNRLIGVTDVFGQLIDYSYDANGNRTKLSLNSATLATYRYDVMDRLTKIIDGSSLSITYGYDVTNKLISRRLPNGVLTNYQYDGLDRLTRLQDAKGVTTVADHQYQYNTANQITQIIESANARSYGYDAVDRLTSATYTNPSQSSENYAYDSVGNRTSSHLSTSYAYQHFNRLIGTSSVNYTYDANGNLTSKTDASGTWTYSWDFENRLKQVVKPGGVSVSYKYDALGRRIQRTPSVGVSTNFVYDVQDVVKDINSDGSTVDYLNGPGIDNKLRLTDSRLSATGPLYFQQDHLGSTTALTNSLGVVTTRITYDGYGNSAGSPLTRYDYTGRERDPDTGLLYYRARWYDPQVGRFISEDPIGLGGGINSFAYVANNPTGHTDPTGLYDIDVHYYLTYYLARSTGCFGDWEARQIAEGDQHSDEDDDKKPGWGNAIAMIGGQPTIVPDIAQRYRNVAFHSFGTYSQNASRATELLFQAYHQSRNPFLFGTYLHFMQDGFSHADYAGNDTWGQATGGQRVDHTNFDPKKAMDMAHATFDALRGFGNRNGCGCNGEPDWKVVQDFIDVGYASWNPLDFGWEVSDAQLRRKIQILGVPWRSSNGR